MSIRSKILRKLYPDTITPDEIGQWFTDLETAELDGNPANGVGLNSAALAKPRVLFVHVLKNAMIPIITNVVIAIPFLYTGSLLLENFFGIPGLGYLGINAILSSDVDVVRALVLIGALLFVVANLITDICYAAADPRVKLK